MAALVGCMVHRMCIPLPSKHWAPGCPQGPELLYFTTWLGLTISNVSNYIQHHENVCQLARAQPPMAKRCSNTGSVQSLRACLLVCGNHNEILFSIHGLSNCTWYKPMIHIIVSRQSAFLARWELVYLKNPHNLGRAWLRNFCNQLHVCYAMACYAMPCHAMQCLWCGMLSCFDTR